MKFFGAIIQLGKRSYEGTYNGARALIRPVGYTGIDTDAQRRQHAVELLLYFDRYERVESARPSSLDPRPGNCSYARQSAQ